MDYYRLSGWLKHHLRTASVMILLASALPRAFMASQVPGLAELVKIIPDAETYIVPARNLIQREAFLNHRGEPLVSRTPGYPFFLAAIMLATGRGLRLTLMVQAIILSFGICAFYWLARQILPPVMALIAGLIAAASPWGAFVASVPLTEGLFLLLLILVFAVIKIIEDATSWVTAGAASFLLGGLTAAMVLVRPLWPAVVLCAVMLFMRLRKWQLAAWALVFVMLVSAVTPLVVWKQRNYRLTKFDGISDVAGITAWHYLAARVTAKANGLDKYAVTRATRLEEQNWRFSVAEADRERWRRAGAVFYDHPILTAYCFAVSAIEHAVHPSADILVPAGLSFRGDYFVLAVLWAGFLLTACVGCFCKANGKQDDGKIDRAWLLAIGFVCLSLTLFSGVSFGQGSRLRVPLESAIPLFASVGLVRMCRGFPTRAALVSRMRLASAFFELRVKRPKHTRNGATRSRATSGRRGR